jgi:hypothetical protein
MNTATLVDSATLNPCTRAASSSVDAALVVVALLLEADVTGQAPNLTTLLHAANETNERAQTTYQLLHATRPTLPTRANCCAWCARPSPWPNG